MTIVEQCNRYKTYLLIFFIGLLIGIFLYFLYFCGLVTEKTELLNLGEGANDIVTLQEGDILEQQIFLCYNFNEIVIDVETYSNEGSVDIIVRNIETGNVEAHYCYINEDLRDTGLCIPFSGRRNCSYIIELQGVGISKENEIRLFTTSQYKQYGNLSYNDENLSNNLCMHVMKETVQGKTFYYFLTLIILIILLLLVYHMVIEKRNKVESVFLVAALSLGIIYMLIFPPYTVEDEPAHFATSYQFASTLLGQEPFDNNGDVLLRKTDAMCLADMGTISSYQYWIQLLQGNEMFVGRQQMVSGSGLQAALNGNIVVFFPCIFGMMIARVLGLGIIPLMFFAKFNNLVAYILFSYYGIKKIPFGKGFLALVALLPMALIEAGSLSYDSLTNGISFAFIGCALSIVYQKREITKKEIITVCLMCFLLGFTKGGLYLLIAGVLLMIFQSIKDMFSKEKKWVWMVWICGIGGYIVSRIGNKIVFGKASAISNLVKAEKVADNGITYLSLQQCIQTPVSTIQIIITNFIDEFATGLGDMIGQRMSWHGVQPPMILVFMIIFALNLALVYDVERIQVTVPKWNKTWVLLIGIAVIVCVEFVMLLDMGISDGTIRGVQGRYFLPIAPLTTILYADKMQIHNEVKMRSVYFATYGIYMVFLLFVILIVLRK